MGFAYQINADNIFVFFFVNIILTVLWQYSLNWRYFTQIFEIWQLPTWLD